MKKIIVASLSALMFVGVVLSLPKSADAAITCPAYIFTRDFRMNQTGTEVVRIQEFLIAKGHLVLEPNVPTGRFRDLTQAALVKYQESKGFVPFPYSTELSNKTRAALRTDMTAMCETQAAFTATTPTITILSPGNGENLTAGNNIPFAWRWTGTSTPPKTPVAYVYKSTSNTEIYGMTLTYKPNLNIQQDVIPYNAGSVAMTGGQYAIEICDGYKSQNNAKYCKKRSFTLGAAAVIPANLQPKLTVTAPNSAVDLKVGETYTIRWTSANLPANAKIAISLIRSDGQNATIAENIPASQQSYSWIVTPSGNWGYGRSDTVSKIAKFLGVKIAEADGYTYKIAVGSNWTTNTSGGTAGDQSDASFTISNTTSTAVTTSINSAVQENAPGRHTANYTFTMGTTSVGNYWRIYINCPDGIEAYDNGASTSNGLFENMCRKSNFTKTNIGSTGQATANITLVNTTRSASRTVQLSATAHTRDGFPLATSTVQIVVTPYLGPVVNEPRRASSTPVVVVTTSQPVTQTVVTPPVLTVRNPDAKGIPVEILAPHGNGYAGESLIVGQTYTIKWTAPGADTVDLNLYRDGTSTRPLIVARVPNTGSYVWTVSRKGFGIGGNYAIVATAWKNASSSKNSVLKFFQINDPVSSSQQSNSYEALFKYYKKVFGKEE